MTNHNVTNPDRSLNTTARASHFFDGFEVISCYSRADAIQDGVLVEVPENLLKEAGINYPMALTQAVWNKYAGWNDHDNDIQKTYQDQEGRLWDILTMFKFAAKQQSGSEMRFSLLVVPKDGKSRTPKPVKLKAIIGPGDTNEPVITILMPNED